MAALCTANQEESGESQFVSSLEIDDSHDLTIANYHGYRVTHSEQPFPCAVRVAHSDNLHFRNVHVDSNSSIAVCGGDGVCRQGFAPTRCRFRRRGRQHALHPERTQPLRRDRLCTRGTRVREQAIR